MTNEFTFPVFFFILKHACIYCSIKIFVYAFSVFLAGFDSPFVHLTVWVKEGRIRIIFLTVIEFTDVFLGKERLRDGGIIGQMMKLTD